MLFRKDINGLRAIAVIAVVLFHFNAYWIPGGFTGVDVFFVISGFLMTGIIFRGLEQENFSILKFYVARANRIIPALAVLCLVLVVFGWFYIAPFGYKILGKHVGISMSFISNVIYWTESGYFDTDSRTKWLLHTWSLSVEWQYYIIYPLVIVTMRKFMSVKTIKATVLLGTVLGVIFCVIATYKWSSAAYYLLPTRAWEMMIGGVAYLYPLTLQKKEKKLLEWTGLILIVSSYFLISKESLWPGYLAIFPVLGSFLIIQAQRNDSLITNNVVFQKLGAWSYSIYLWHWPLVVAIYYFSLNKNLIYLGLVLSVLLGFLSNKYIEKIRFKNNFSGLLGYLKCKPFYMILFIGFLAGCIYYYDGVLGNKINISIRAAYDDFLYEKDRALKLYNTNTTHPQKHYKKGYTCSLDENMDFESVTDCLIGGISNDSYNIVVIGDSNGRDFFHALRFAYPNYNIVMLHQSSCSPAYGIRWDDTYCFKDLESYLDLLNNSDAVDAIVFASRYVDESTYLDFIKNVNYYTPNKTKVVVNTTGFIDRDVTEYLFKYGVKDFYEIEPRFLKKTREINDQIQQVQGDNIRVFNRFNVFCNSDGSCNLMKGYKVIFIDDQHLSEVGIKILSKSIIKSKLFEFNHK